MGAGRPVETEAVFGQVKANRRFKRFLFGGFDKVIAAFVLVASAHDLMKLL